MPADDHDVHVVADDVLVVRTPGAWAVTPAGGRHPAAVDGEDLVALLTATADGGGALRSDLAATLISAGVLVPGERANARRPEAAEGWRHHEPLDEDTVLEPRAAVVARLTTALVLDGTDGQRLELDAVDVRLLDAIDGWITVGQVVDAVLDDGDREALARRLARLAASGRVRVARLVERESAPVEVPPPPTPGRLRRVAARLRAVRPTPVDSASEAADASGPPTAPAADPPEVAASSGIEDVTPSIVPDEPGVPYLSDPFPGGPAGPVPVYAVWPARTGPVLALGMLTAAARHHDGGRLAEHYEIRRPEDPASFFADLERRDGPGVLLLSNYVWSIEENLDVARRARRLRPDLVVVHGGPSTPKYEADNEAFFLEHEGLVDVTVRGEGEATLVEVLDALGPALPAVALDRLSDVAGLSYRDPSTLQVVRTPDRDRIVDLDALPSPYLHGEFDHLAAAAWDVPSGLLGLVIESNRGCPYGCTFCDWGSSTLSRIRKFGLERLEAEMRWAAARGHKAWIIADANFGIMSRDVDIARRLVAVKEEHGNPTDFGFNVAKNTTKHLTAILDVLVGGGVTPHFSLALQTRDEATLAAIDRQNISTDHYLALAAAFRRRGLPLHADIMVGLPGQTVDSFAGDLQFLMDNEIPARMWITELLPNAPMNDPTYRERHAIQAADNLVVTATSTFTAADRETMMRLRHAYTAFERFGLLRHVVRHAQWDHGVPAMSILRRIQERSEHAPGEYPLLNWVMRYFDYFNVPPVGWPTFFAEVGAFLDREFGIGPSPAREAVLEAQAFLLPDADRTFPATLPLAHDVVAYVRDHTRGLWADGTGSRGRPLAQYEPGVLTVYGDPLERCQRGLTVNQDPRNEVLTEQFWLVGHWELDSPLVVNCSEVAGSGAYRGLPETIPADLGELRGADEGRVGRSAVALSVASSTRAPVLD